MTLWTLLTLLFSFGALTWGWFQLRRAHKQQEINILLAGAVEELYSTTAKEIQRNKKLVETAAELTKDAKMALGVAEGGELMEDAGMLATMVTAIVHKYGDIKLGMTDFTSLTDDDFISVYIDTASQDMILSLKQDLASSEADVSFTSYGRPDDETFH